MKIGKLSIGPSLPVRIIAELGTLHHHSYDSLIRATRDCVRAGADMVKIQCIDPDRAFWATHEQYKRYCDHYYNGVRGDLWRKYFLWASNNFEQPVFPSCFDVNTITSLHDVVPAYKIASMYTVTKRTIKNMSQITLIIVIFKELLNISIGKWHIADLRPLVIYDAHLPVLVCQLIAG